MFTFQDFSNEEKNYLNPFPLFQYIYLDIMEIDNQFFVEYY